MSKIEKTQKKHILVTGGAGFLGRHLCEKLLQDKNNVVFCLDNLITGSMNNIKEFLENPDLSSSFIFINENIIYIDSESHNYPIQYLTHLDEIYHLACIASPDKYMMYSIETLETCFLGTKNVLELAKKFGSKLLFSSTSEVYGDPTVHPQPETYYGNVNTISCRSCYDEGKRVAETLIYEYRMKHKVNAKIIRIFNTYGPYMELNDGRVITNFIKQIMKNEPLQIYGNGLQTRSFCYVDDLIKGIIKMMESDELGPINLGNPHCEFTLLELIEKFEIILERKLHYNLLAATENDPKQRKPVITLARERLGFEPNVDLLTGLKNTWDYCNESNL